MHAVLKMHDEPIGGGDESVSDTCSDSCDDDEPELVKVASGDLLLSDDDCDDDESELVEVSSGELLLSTLMDVCDH